MGHIVEVQYMKRCNNKATILKLNKNEYIDLSSGELKEYEHMEHRGQSKNSLYQTFKKLRYLINNNFMGNENELFVTLTYAENMTCAKRLYADFDKFMKRLRYRYKNKSTIDYISVVEPQSRGAWHCHVLMRFNELDSIYIANSSLRTLWGHGFVRVNRINNIDNIGAYLTAYLTDIELTEETICCLQPGMRIKDVMGKRYIKGGRVHMYPAGMNLYRRSRGIKSPKREKMSYKDAKRVVRATKPHYSKMYSIVDNDFENVIICEQYNFKRQL